MAEKIQVSRIYELDEGVYADGSYVVIDDGVASHKLKKLPLSKIKGTPGERGPQGPQGPKGDKGDKGDAGVSGTDGVSPTVTVTPFEPVGDTPGGYTITITDATHPSGQTFEVYNGTDNHIHNLIVQIKYIKVSGQTVPRNIVCDKQKYTLNNGNYVFEPVDIYALANWNNRGDVISIGREVAADPWGDGYPTYIYEFQALQDNDGYWYCTNVGVFYYNGSSVVSKWGNMITDEDTGKEYMEFQTW